MGSQYSSGGEEQASAGSLKGDRGNEQKDQRWERKVAREKRGRTSMGNWRWGESGEQEAEYRQCVQHACPAKPCA